jgi:Caenorhabditis protein of unknown function, DUF268
MYNKKVYKSFLGFRYNKYKTNFFKPAVKAFLSDVKKYQEMHSSAHFPFVWNNVEARLKDRFEEAGHIDQHYFLQDIYVAKQIYKNNPLKHIDVGSRIDGFISHLLVFRDVTVIDIRPLPHVIEGLSFIQDSAVELSQIEDGSVESFSCLHTAEHFGLGRYGDPIDPDAPWKFAKSVSRVLAKNGLFYFSVPVGKEKLSFNTHRIFAVQTVLDMFKDFELLNFASIGNEFDLVENQSLDLMNRYDYACGIFTFRKK